MPDSFKEQLQTVLTAYNEDVNGVQGASVCHKTKVVKRKFEDQEDARTTQGEDAAADAAADTVIPATPPHGGAAAACPQPWGQGRC
jgi:hypothetical protein